MRRKDLVFYNKEGYKINMLRDGDNILYNSMFFDRNSTDTYKTQSLYLFENVIGTSNNFNDIDLVPYQIFNTDGIYCYPSDNSIHVIEDIIPTNDDVNFSTKWIKINNIHKFTEPGMYVRLNTSHISPSNSNTNNIYQIVKTKKHHIMVVTNDTNNNFAPYTLSGETCNLLNVIETGYDSSMSTDINFSQTPYTNHIKQRFSLITNDNNAGTYTTHEVPVPKQKYSYILGSNIISTPNLDMKLVINIKFKTDRIIIGDGSNIEFTATDTILFDYVPKFLKVGDFITFVGTTSNDTDFKIEEIDFENNIIYVDSSTPTTLEGPVSCMVYKTHNQYTIEQDIVKDKNNNASLLVTYSSIISNFQNELYEMGDILNLKYIGDSLVIDTDLVDDLFEIEVWLHETGNTPQSLMPLVTQSTKDVYPIIVDELLLEYSYIPPNSDNYKRSIEILDIDNNIVISINGVDYLEPFDTDINTTINNWISNYNSEINKEFINITHTGINSLGYHEILIESLYPNTPVFLNIVGATYLVKYQTYKIDDIKNQLLFTINNKNYMETYNTSITQTIDSWILKYKNPLEQDNIFVREYTSNEITFCTPFIDVNIDIDLNIGYKPKEGDKAYEIITEMINNSYDVISGNKLDNGGVFNFIDFYHIGQTLTITGSDYNTVNTAYTIIEMEPDYITLSYQGTWDNTVEQLSEISIQSDDFIKYPQHGLSTDNRKGKFRWSWKDTQIDDFFLYDFSGDQLKPYFPGFPDYSGIKPLCGLDGNIKLRLIKEPNTELKYISNPQKQQTVFDTIENILPWRDEVSVDEILPHPVQLFMGYNCKHEMWNKARIHLEFIEDIKETITAKIDSTWAGPIPDPTVDSPNHILNIIVFKDNYMTIENHDGTINFINMGLKKDQTIELGFEDITEDDIDNMTFTNNSTPLMIENVSQTKITFTTNVEELSMVQAVEKSTYPTNDTLGNPIIEWRLGACTFKVLPKLMAYFDVYGESVEEDDRLKINLNNRNKDILTMKDFFIFKDVDINEEGIDWIYLNAKRKELLEVYPEIFNHISSYKSIVRAINFFGYNDLIFSEYFQNVNPESSKFGQIFNLELLNILDKHNKEIKYNNLEFANMRNRGYIKTNVFSLGYRITDEFGNFVQAYSLKEVQIKLLGLKRWLTKHIVPIGSKILDIHAMYKMQSEFKLNHETYMIKNFNVEEYSIAPYFDVQLFKNIVYGGTNTYDVAVEFKLKEEDNNDLFYSYEIRTYNIEIWNNVNYNPNSYVIYDGKYYTNGNNFATEDDEPLISSIWLETTIHNIPIIQQFRDSKHELTSVSFTINEMIDPFFDICVKWHSGYGNTYSYRRTYHAEIYHNPVNIPQ